MIISKETDKLSKIQIDDYNSIVICIRYLKEYTNYDTNRHYDTDSNGCWVNKTYLGFVSFMSQNGGHILYVDFDAYKLLFDYIPIGKVKVIFS